MDFLRGLFRAGPAPPAGLLLVRSPRAKRYLLRVLSDGTARVTVPSRGSEREALAFAARHQEWIARQREKLRTRPAPNSAWHAGDTVLLRGQAFSIAVENGRVRLGELCVPAPDASADLRPALEPHLRRLAATELPDRTLALAAQHGFAVKRVTVRAQRSRWGSCSARGTISLNWRLIQAPDSVRDYIILHELAHLRHMNHSRRFWAEVARLCPAWRDAERWLKQNPLR